MSALNSRYSDPLLAWEYDQRNGKLMQGELDWYLGELGVPRGDILELAAGSGRLTLALLKHGYSIVALDNSQTMLARLKASALPEFEDRLSTMCCDMRDIVWDGQAYHRALIPYNSLQYLQSRAQIQDVIRKVHSVLGAGGKLLVDLQVPDPSGYREPIVVDWMNSPIVDDARGWSVGSRFLIRLSGDGRFLIKEREYKVREGDAIRQISEETRQELMSIPDWIDTFQTAGFSVVARQEYGRTPVQGPWGSLCISARKDG